MVILTLITRSRTRIRLFEESKDTKDSTELSTGYNAILLLNHVMHLSGESTVCSTGEVLIHFGKIIKCRNHHEYKLIRIWIISRSNYRTCIREGCLFSREKALKDVNSRVWFCFLSNFWSVNFFLANPTGK